MALGQVETVAASNDDEIRAELIGAVREIVRYALMTLNALRDPDKRYQGWARLPMHVVHDTREAYGYASPAVRRFHPTPRDIDQMEVVVPWLAWLRREHGECAVRRVIGWSLGLPLWRIGQREGCSDRTVSNRIDRSICAIIQQFVGVDLPVERIEEPYRGQVYAMVWEYPQGPVSGEVKLMKIYIGGRGLWQAGKGFLDGRRGYGLRTAERLAKKIA
jgi:hypothetical protein